MTNVLASGSFTSTGAAFNLAIESSFDQFEMYNITDIGSTAANTNVMYAQFVSGMPAASALFNPKTNGAATWAITNMTTTGGFTVFDNGNPPVGSLVALTGITAASPAVITSNGHPFVVGDTIRLTSVNGTMQIMSGLVFSVIATTNNTLTISFDASDAAIGGTPATSGNIQKITPSYFDPMNHVIGPTATGTINAGPGSTLQLCLNVCPQFINGGTTYQPGAKLRITVPNVGASTYGTGATFAPPSTVIGTISTVTAQGGYNSKANLITFSDLVLASPALLYPAGSASAKFIYPFVSDIAEKATILTEAEDNKGIRGITIGTTVQTNGKLYQWFARRGQSI